jgi:transposase
MEVGTDSPWVSRLVAQAGHEVIVANPRQVKLISKGQRKNDRRDAELLARLGLSDPQLLSPINHRSEDAQRDRARVKVRAGLVDCRSKLINVVRGLLKSITGRRLPSCSAEVFARRVRELLPADELDLVEEGLATIEELSKKVKACDRELKKLVEGKYGKETQGMRQVPGVGPLLSLYFVLTLEDPNRFARARSVAPYLGLVPKQHQSGERDPACRIGKGDAYLRSLLNQGAHYILGMHGPDCDLRRFGLRIASNGGKYAKRKAIVAVMRKLSVVLFRLWTSGEPYDPNRNFKLDDSQKEYRLQAA